MAQFKAATAHRFRCLVSVAAVMSLTFHVEASRDGDQVHEAPFEGVKEEIQERLSQAADKLVQSSLAQADITQKVAGHIGKYHTHVKNIAKTMGDVMKAKTALTQAYHEDLKTGEEKRIGALEVDLPVVLGEDFELPAAGFSTEAGQEDTVMRSAPMLEAGRDVDEEGDGSDVLEAQKAEVLSQQDSSELNGDRPMPSRSMPSLDNVASENEQVDDLANAGVPSAREDKEDLGSADNREVLETTAEVMNSNEGSNEVEDDAQNSATEDRDSGSGERGSSQDSGRSGSQDRDAGSDDLVRGSTQDREAGNSAEQSDDRDVEVDADEEGQKIEWPGVPANGKENSELQITEGERSEHRPQHTLKHRRTATAPSQPHRHSNKVQRLSMLLHRSRAVPAHVRGGYGLKGTGKARMMSHHLGSKHLSAHHRSHSGVHRHHRTSVAVRPRSFQRQRMDE